MNEEAILAQAVVTDVSLSSDQLGWLLVSLVLAVVLMILQFTGD